MPETNINSMLIILQLKKDFLKACPEDIQNTPHDICEFSGHLLFLHAPHHNNADVKFHPFVNLCYLPPYTPMSFVRIVDFTTKMQERGIT